MSDITDLTKITAYFFIAPYQHDGYNAYYIDDIFFKLQNNCHVVTFLPKFYF